VHNTRAELNPGSVSATTGTCPNHQNLIYHALTFYDDNKDGPVKVLSVTDQSGIITSMTAELIYFDNSSSPSISKYAIYGFIGNGGGSTVILQVSDGYTVTPVILP